MTGLDQWKIRNTIAFHVLTDAEIAATAPTEAQLQAAIKAVCAMSNREFLQACKAIGLKPQHDSVIRRDYHWQVTQ